MYGVGFRMLQSSNTVLSSPITAPPCTLSLPPRLYTDMPEGKMLVGLTDTEFRSETIRMPLRQTGHRRGVVTGAYWQVEK